MMLCSRDGLCGVGLCLLGLSEFPDIGSVPPQLSEQF